jgi:hypothetical protein
MPIVPSEGTEDYNASRRPMSLDDVCERMKPATSDLLRAAGYGISRHVAHNDAHNVDMPSAERVHLFLIIAKDI